MWVDELKNKYLNHKKSVFLLHGNVDDLFELQNGHDAELSEYLSQEIFSKRDIVLNFNIGTGIRFRDQDSKKEFQKLLWGYDNTRGTNFSDRLPSDSGEIFRLLNLFIKVTGKEKSIALIINHADLLIPNEELSSLNLDDKKVIVTLDEWAKDEDIKAKNITILLISPALSQLNQKINSNPDISKIKIDFPGEQERKKAVKKYSSQFSIQADLSQSAVSKIINGLNKKDILQLFLKFQDKKIELDYLSRVKKELIEESNAQFFEFVETSRSLSDVSGHTKAKKRLREDAKLLKLGKLDAVPMGYLLCGPVGTGKTYLTECFAGEIGVPVVKLKNFRDKYVGQSEANWEKILATLKNLAPIVILIDEADATLGNREDGGDSGTSKRIFAEIAQTMGDTKNRGKLIWMLVTARPELLPIDLKRQGRAEVHIPLFYPKDLKEKKDLFKEMTKKHDIKNIRTLIDELKEKDLLEVKSGADIESILIKTKRYSYISGKLEKKDFIKILESFRSSLSEEAIQKQINSAMNEVTDMELV
jgi:AAA+ superfamily predicted ATPase